MQEVISIKYGLLLRSVMEKLAEANEMVKYELLKGTVILLVSF